MKVIIAICLLLAVPAIFARHHKPPHKRQDGAKIKQGIEEALKKAGEKFYNKFLKGKTACTGTDLEKLHKAHMEELGLEEEEAAEVLGEFLLESSEEGSEKLDLEGLGELMGYTEEDMNAVVSELKKEWPEISSYLKLTAGCTAEETLKAMNIGFKHRDALRKTIMNALRAKFGNVVDKIRKAVKNHLKNATPKIKAQYFPNTKCNDKDLHKIGKAVAHFLEMIPEEHFEETLADISLENAKSHIEEFKKSFGVKCSVKDIFEVSAAIMENFEAIEAIIDDAVEAGYLEATAKRALSRREISDVAFSKMTRGMPEGALKVKRMFSRIYGF